MIYSYSNMESRTIFLILNQREFINTFVLGHGNIGSNICQSFYKLGADVSTYDVNFKKDTKLKYNIFYDESWKNSLKNIDYFIVAVDNKNSNQNLIDSGILNKMGKNTCLVNISRGKIVNQTNLIKYINKKKIRGAILDVFEKRATDIFNQFGEMKIS